MAIPLLVLSIESSCDETSLAVLNQDYQIIAQQTYTQHKEHLPFGGVVPEIASRAHYERIDQLMSALFSDLIKVLPQFSWNQLSHIAVTNTPGLIGALVVGVGFAKGLAYRLNKPLIAVNHLHGHMAAGLIALEKGQLNLPNLTVLLSGGHSAFYYVDSQFRAKAYSETVDDAVGEAFDKTGQLLGLPYPGGAQLEVLAASYNGEVPAISLPVPMCQKNQTDFSLSGLKTAVYQYCLKYKQSHQQESLNLDEAHKQMLAFAFQKAVLQMLQYKIVQTCSRLKQDQISIKQIVFCGGVASNRYLRKGLIESSTSDIEVVFPIKSLCTDNAAMIAAKAIWDIKNNSQPLSPINTPLKCGPNLRLNARPSGQLSHQTP